ncbi:MAG: ATP-binding cassette domain-containing protein [Candidatus Riflebacteria bacterium]|nr:ATP-binding cassette domain-containing protein [Candidatus Riflebacteria bacterium]
MEPIIETNGLGKQFRLLEKKTGLMGSLKSLFRPNYRLVNAVCDVSLKIMQGEITAFIGPNGAGKSTTIKMLTGILHPSSGSAQVLGFTPWTQRRELSYQIGSVLGQRSQLWMHLPAGDSFRLLGHIYEVPKRDFERRLGSFVELFDLRDIIEVPVRKLSLGQRMRCEIAASLLHGPRVIFLDEPTIGLDVIAKDKIRKLVQTANESEGLTILLTSHDPGDIEKLCRRVVIIDHGQVLLDTDVQTLKRSPHFSVRTVSARLRTPFDGSVAINLPGVELLKSKGQGIKLRVDTALTPIESVLREIIDISGIEDVAVRPPSLEEIIAHIYQHKGLSMVPSGPSIPGKDFQQESDESSMENSVPEAD